VLRRYFNSIEITCNFYLLDKMNELNINDELYALVCQSDHANELDSRLKILPNTDEILMLLHRRSDQCVSLLMLAALYGKDEMVRVILSHSSDVNNLVELQGNVFRINGTLVRNATALWCACDRGHYTVARTLIELGGAKIDHGPRYPLLIDAVIVGRLDTVRFLIENGYANVNNTGDNESYKLNSLIMAVIYGHTQIVAFLLEKGSKFDYTTPSSSNTPLGYAAIKGHLDIIRLLCSAGACSSIKNKNGQTPLMLAAKYERMHVIDYLLEQNDIETGIQQLEFVACSYITPMSSSTIQPGQFQRMLNLMRKIFEIRKIKNLPKIIAQPIAAYGFQQECQTIEELNNIQYDNDRLYIEVLLIRERILVPEKNETLFKPLLLRGDKLVERGQYELCLHLWEHTFHLYQNMDLETGLHRFVWLFCKMISLKVPISPQRFVQISRLTFEPSQQKPRDDYIKNALCFVAIGVKILEQSTLTNAERHLIHQWIKDLCRQKRSTSLGQTLLHLCVDRQTYHDINYRANDIKPILK
jgi:ankyrin repeat protein